MSDSVLPDLIQRRRPERRLSFWCAACSTGQEPYSIAITLCEAYGSLTPPAQIVATDIDTNVLTVGSNGVYPMERVEKMSPERLKRLIPN